MKFLNYFLVLTFFGLITACSSVSSQPKVPGYHIIGEILNAGGKTIYLDRASLDGNIFVDTAIIDNSGKFEMKKPITDEGIYVLRIDQAHTWAIYLEVGQINLKANFDDILNFSSTGSYATIIISDFIKMISQSATRVQELTIEFNQARMSGDAQKMQQLQQEYFMIENNKSQIIKSFIDTVSVPEIAVFAISLLNLEQEMEYISTKVDKFEQDIPNSPWTVSFLKKYNAKKRLAIGGTAPEFEMKSPQGKNVGWKEVDGEVILLDFWASWCRPCRAENPNLVRTYNKYKSKGFNIYSVSLDKNMQKWVGAIEADGLIWPYHGSELKGWQCSVSKQFEVSSIPATYLIDKDGKILAKNLRGIALDNKLVEIYGM